MTGWGYYVQNVIWRLLESPRDVTGIPQVLTGGENIAEEISCLHLLGRFVLEDHSISSHIQTFLSPFKMSINTTSYYLDRRQNSGGKIKYIFFYQYGGVGEDSITSWSLKNVAAMMAAASKQQLGWMTNGCGLEAHKATCKKSSFSDAVVW